MMAIRNQPVSFSMSRIMNSWKPIVISSGNILTQNINMYICIMYAIQTLMALHNHEAKSALGQVAQYRT